MAMSGPSTRLGMQNPSVAAAIASRSSIVNGLNPAIAPTGTPSTSDTISAATPTLAETGKLSAMISPTPRPLNRYESGSLSVAKFHKCRPSCTYHGLSSP